MFNNNEQLKTLSQAQFDKAVRLSNIVLASAERFANLHLELSKKLLADQAATTKALVPLLVNQKSGMSEKLRVK